MVEAPTGTVTFLFTDIAGSTRLWEERPDEMRAALAEHDALIRAAIDACSGYVFSTGGDGFAVAFSRAADAIDAASKAQAALAGHPLLRVRMGIHTGEVQERNGDYFGPAVNRAARIIAAGHGGQVLVSHTAADLAPPAVTLVDLGTHRLRDLDREEHVYQLGPGSFPKLRTVGEAARTNLPTPRSSFLGREDDLRALTLLAGTSELVTITGPGGVGKTRTAIRVGHELADRFDDGVWWLELGPVTNVEEVDAAVAATLRVQRRDGLSFTDSIVDQLRRQCALLLFDNCEHVIESASRLIDVITGACDRVTVLATSRESLGLDGEHVYPLGPLALPEGDSAEAVARASATALFVDRARAVDPAFVLDDANAGSIARLCRRLDAMPLALELAAAKTVALAPSQIEQMLDERFRMLTRANRDVPRRQQTLEATIAWSYDLLGDDEATLLDRLSVFAGSFALEAAQAVAGDDPLDAFAVAEHLTSLVRKSLVVARRVRGERRFSLLESVRAFAERRLVASGGWAHYRARHLRYWVEFTQRAGIGLVSLQEPVWTERVVDELDELRHAFLWAATQYLIDDAFAIVAAIGRLGWLYPSTGIHTWCEEALRLDGGIDHPLSAEAAQWAAAALAIIGDLDRSQRLAEFATSREPAMGASVPFAWMTRAGIAAASGRADEAIAGAHAMVASATRQPRPDSATAVGIAANIFAAGGQGEVALQTARLAVELSDENPTPSNRFFAYEGVAYALMDDPEASVRAADQAVDALVDSTHFPQLVWTLMPRAAANLRFERFADALTDITAGLHAADRSGQRWAVYQMLALAISVLRRAGDPQSAMAIGAAVRALVGTATGVYWDEFVVPGVDSPGVLPSVALRDYDDLVAFARAALSAAAPRIGAL